MAANRYPIANGVCAWAAFLMSFCLLTNAAEPPAGQVGKPGETWGEWKPLFNGQNLDGWYTWVKGKKNEDPDKLIQIHDGMIHMYKDATEGTTQPSGYVATEREYSDYHLRLEYKWGEKRFAPRAKVKRDAGLLYGVGGPDVVWPRCVECQIQEGDVGDIFTVNTRVTGMVDPGTTNLVRNVVTNAANGAVRTNETMQPVFRELEAGGMPLVQGVASGIRRVIRNPKYEEPGWNRVEIIVRGASSVHIVNGKVNNRTTLIEKPVADGWEPLSKGKIALQLEFAEVMYRNVEIRELKAEDPR